MKHRYLARAAWMVAGGLLACGPSPPAEAPVRVRASPPAEQTDETCELAADESAAMYTIRGPDGISVRHPNLDFSLMLPSHDVQPVREERPLMLSALRFDERTVSHPFFDEFSRSFLVVRVTKLDVATSLQKYLRAVEREIETGAKKELGAKASVGQWSRSGATSNAVIDERLYVEIRGWPVGTPKDGCALAVVGIGVSIEPSEMPSVMDSFEQ